MGYSSSYSVKIVCFFLFILVGATSSQNTKCPFQYLYHFGDGVTDVGNSVRVLPWGPSLPAARLPYGKTYPGRPTGRWSDGLIDFDFAAADFGFPQITPYLSRNATSSNGVIFSVARSPVLHHKFFRSRGVKIPHYVVPLSTQLSWLKNNDLQQAMNNLSREFPNVSLLYGPFDEGVLSVLAESSTPGPNGNMALKSCCGIGGKYNYDSKRFCGSPGVPVCPNPDQYIFWDGLHFTQEASARIEKILIQPTLSTLNCTSQLSVFM